MNYFPFRIVQLFGVSVFGLSMRTMTEMVGLVAGTEQLTPGEKWTLTGFAMALFVLFFSMFQRLLKRHFDLMDRRYRENDEAHERRYRELKARTDELEKYRDNHLTQALTQIQAKLDTLPGPQVARS